MIAALAAGAAPLVSNLANQLATNDKDQQRFATAQSWYSQAIQGDSISLCMLQYMGGRRGTGMCGGNQTSGFATQEAKDYTEQLYQQALRVLSGQASPGSLVPNPPVPTVSPTGQVIQAVSTGVANVGTAVGQTPTPTAAQQMDLAKKWGTYALVAGAIVLVGWFLLKRR